MTELSPVCHMTPAGNDKHGSVGVLLPNLRCKVKLSGYLDRETACMHQMERPHIHHNTTYAWLSALYTLFVYMSICCSHSDKKECPIFSEGVHFHSQNLK